MGTWDSGPFDNDATADFLAESGGSINELESLLRRCADTSAEEYLDGDDGQPAIAVCELVALGFGYGDVERAPANVRAIARKLGPNEKLRLLAIRAFQRVRGHRSEIASLWAHEPEFDTLLANLAERLSEAGD
jgi:hypothetical protein